MCFTAWTREVELKFNGSTIIQPVFPLIIRQRNSTHESRECMHAKIWFFERHKLSYTFFLNSHIIILQWLFL